MSCIRKHVVGDEQLNWNYQQKNWTQNISWSKYNNAVNKIHFWQRVPSIHTSLRRRVRHHKELSVRQTATRPQIDIQSVSRHCFPIDPYWELAHAPRRYSAIKTQFVYENLLYSPLPRYGFFSYGSDPAERNHLIQFPFCIHHTRGCLTKGNIVGFCLNTWIAFGSHVLLLLVSIE